MSVEKTEILKKVIKKLDLNQWTTKEKAERRLTAVLEMIPQEALEVFLKYKEKFIDILARVANLEFKYIDHTEEAIIRNTAVSLAYKLIDNVLPDTFITTSLFPGRDNLSLAFLFSAGYLKLYGMSEAKNVEIPISLAHAILKYRNLENLEERMQEGQENVKLFNLFKMADVESTLFIFFIKEVYGVEIETLDGEPPTYYFTNVKNAEELNKVISLKDINLHKQRGEEILHAFIEEFPFTENVFERFKKYSEPNRFFSLIFGMHSKEKLFKAFRENYKELANIYTGLDRYYHASICISAGAINKSLYNQKDLFLCNAELCNIPPHYLLPAKATIDGIKVIINNGYEDLAYELILGLIHPKGWATKALKVYLERYKDKPEMLLNVKLAASYYMFYKKIVDTSNYTEETLNNFLNTVEKVFRKESKTIVEVWL